MRLLRKNLPFLLMGAPGFLLLVVFSYLPMFGVIIAFKKYRAVQGIWGSEWVGLKNPRNMRVRGSVAALSARSCILARPLGPLS